MEGRGREKGSSNIPAGVRRRLPSVLQLNRRKKGVEFASEYNLIVSSDGCCGCREVRVEAEVFVGFAEEEEAGGSVEEEEEEVERSSMTAGRGAGEGDLKGLLETGPNAGDLEVAVVLEEDLLEFPGLAVEVG